jgi:hypothetical protein
MIRGEYHCSVYDEDLGDYSFKGPSGQHVLRCGSDWLARGIASALRAAYMAGRRDRTEEIKKVLDDKIR